MKKIYSLILLSFVASGFGQTNVFYPNDGSPYLQVHPGANLSLVGVDMGEGVTRFELFNTDPDQSTTNEIELPSQNGQNGKFLGTNGTTQNWLPITTSVSAPSIGNTFTSGTAFQPRAGGACQMNVLGTLTGLVGVTGTITVSMSATSGGTYSTVSTNRLLVSVTGVTSDTDTGGILVPSGWYVKITLTGTAAATYTRWDI